ncbi:hypothetical protein [Empedobacter tilapiae]|uniref:Uncharacterized protein n=1 Tax=Empedobacter tilapiae TaxID=2491114 RepID=A0A4Z1B4E4_9FLAO|nr:hypothetical protein [Empedobacter tilapiae]TGN21947.1 hypothetical protein E4J94_16790 [Empedobacter tilapiae]
MKSKLLIGILICFLLSCNKFESKQKRIFNSENFNNYEIEFSNLDYNFNLNSGVIESDYFEIKDSIVLTKNEKNKIAKLFFENYMDTIKSETYVMNKEGLSIMPDTGINSIKINNISIVIGGLSDSLHVDEKGKNILRFREKIFEVLKQNNNFNKTINEIESKPDDRLFL